MRSAYQAIGKLYHQDKIAGAVAAGPAYDEQLDRINAALRRIGELRSQRDVTAPPPPEAEAYAQAEDFADIAD